MKYLLIEYRNNRIIGTGEYDFLKDAIGDGEGMVRWSHKKNKTKHVEIKHSSWGNNSMTCKPIPMNKRRGKEGWLVRWIF